MFHVPNEASDTISQRLDSTEARSELRKGVHTTCLTCLIVSRFGILRLPTAYLFRRCASIPAQTDCERLAHRASGQPGGRRCWPRAYRSNCRSTGGPDQSAGLRHLERHKIVGAVSGSEKPIRRENREPVQNPKPRHFKPFEFFDHTPCVATHQVDNRQAG